MRLKNNPEEEPHFDIPICSACGDPCIGEWVDFGVGPGEFWGRPYNDVDMQYVSDCCEAEIKEGADYDNFYNKV